MCVSVGQLQRWGFFFLREAFSNSLRTNHSLALRLWGTGGIPQIGRDVTELEQILGRRILMGGCAGEDGSSKGQGRTQIRSPHAGLD